MKLHRIQIGAWYGCRLPEGRGRDWQAVAIERHKPQAGDHPVTLVRLRSASGREILSPCGLIK